MCDAENIRAVAAFDPDYLGFIFYPGSKRYINADAVHLAGLDLPGVRRTGVFVNATLESILKKIALYHLDAVQLHGRETPEFCKRLKEAGTEVIKAFGVDPTFDFAHLEGYVSDCDYFLFDTRTQHHGGSGKMFDWSILTSYKHEKKYFLSGGLSLDSIQAIKAITDDRLYAVDLNSKFETEPGMKDIEKLSLAFQQLKKIRL